MTHENEDSPVSPHAPDVKNPATESPTTMVAGTMTGLKRMKSGVVTASPSRVPARASPANNSNVPPIGSPVMTAITLDVDGPLSA
ncbi:hypothetical protein Ahy_B06g084987 [Arachis hypogaea]|uniref:Uncharacterized protein n=1 Tax=Arachis hypogaea TaxID=3818 RepID=A0A444YTA2_ARAHY|nr:hypothetical protein Ahy_B06g084987 [Arachis hypogaea]